MNYQEFKETLQKSVAALSGLISSVDGSAADEAFGKTVAENGGAEKLIRRELSEYFMYLAAADGEVSEIEANMISDCLCECKTRQEIQQAATENKLRFSQTIPEILKMSVVVANRLYKAIGNYDVPRCYEVVMLAYIGLGEVVINADGDFNEMEAMAYRSYINHMKEYVEENFEGSQNAASANGNQ